MPGCEKAFKIIRLNSSEALRGHEESVFISILELKIFLPFEYFFFHFSKSKLLHFFSQICFTFRNYRKTKKKEKNNRRGFGSESIWKYC